MSGYTRSFTSPQTTRDPTIPRFHMEAVEDPIASESAGRPIFRSEERVQFIQPGNPNSPVQLVTNAERERWPEQYAAFRRGEEATVDGTPLEQWPFLKKNHVLELKAMGIFTVEQAAGLPDQACQKIGMGGTAIRENAKAYLNDADAMKIVSQSIADKEAADAKVANLERQLDEMRAIVDRLHKEQMMMRDAPPATETYIPGQHDPVQRAAQAAQQPVSGSSLDSLTAPRRARQRAEAQA